MPANYAISGERGVRHAVMEQQSNLLSMHQNQIAISDQLHYKELVREQEEGKMRGQVSLLQNQVASLKQIVEIMEKETARNDD